MVVLKKIKASTLMETMVATVLIIIIFMISSMLLNLVLATQIKNNTQGVSTRMEELEYEYMNNLIALPYLEDWNTWEIQLNKQQFKGKTITTIAAKNTITKKELSVPINVEK